MMQLYWSDVLAPRKVCVAARYLGIPLDYVYVDIGRGEQKTPGYLALNPNGTVPTLVDGDRTIWESDAIICHLSDLAGGRLWPHDERQVDLLRWLGWSAQHFNRCGGELYFQHVIKPRFGMGDPDPKATEPAMLDFRRLAKILDDHLHGRDWLVGDTITAADISASATLPFAPQTPLPIDDFPELRRWRDRLATLPAWSDPFPPR